MPKLVLVKTPDGTESGRSYDLGTEPVLIGRSPDRCKIVLPISAVSREHAQVIGENGKFFIEDLNSRNFTFLNNQKVVGRSPELKEGDRVKICDFLFHYIDEQKYPTDTLTGSKIGNMRPFEEPDDTTQSTIEAKLDRLSSKQLLESQPQEKLRALVEITTSLGKTIEIKNLLPTIAEELLKLFKQADRCFFIELNESNHLVPTVCKLRRPMDGADQFSRTIVRKCLESHQSFLSEDATTDANVGMAQSIADFRIRSVMCVPLVTQDNHALGVVQLDTQDRTKKFTQDDLKFLACVAVQATVALENARIHEKLLSQQKIEEEQKSAASVQRNFLPQSYPQLNGYDFFAHYMSARTVGGDYYDFIALPDGRQIVLLGDVSGKGVPAALLMARLSGEARVATLQGKDLSEIISILNQRMIDANLGDRYVTLAAFLIDPETNVVEIVNAGHISPLLVRTDTKTIEPLFPKGHNNFPIGWIDGHQFSSIQLTLDVGDSILVYTDGVEDAQPNTGERFKADGVYRVLGVALNDSEPQKASLLGNRVINAVTDYTGNHPQFDDIALVCFGRYCEELVLELSPIGDTRDD
ncbi:MAG: SpoIIE family protein phosphatase [Zavarzinella sp.]